MLTAVYATLFYIATLILIVGVAHRVWVYWNIPTPLVIPTMPAPRTTRGVIFRMFTEITLFSSLFRSNKWIWAFGWMFHIGLLLVTLRHFRYFQEPTWFWVNWAQPFGIYGGMLMVAGLLGLLGRRFFVERIRYISTPSDYLILVLIIMIGSTGLMMKYIFRTDIIAVKEFTLGLIVFDWHSIPADAIFLIHFTLVIVLMIVFPISKLMHAPGIFFSPTRNQKDDSRERRHISSWAKKLDKE